MSLCAAPAAALALLLIPLAATAAGQTGGNYKIPADTLDEGVGAQTSPNYAIGTSSLGQTFFGGSAAQTSSSSSSSWAINAGFESQVDVPVPSLSATTITFGNLTVGSTSSAQTVTLTNDGGAPLGGISVGVPVAQSPDYAVSGSCVPLGTLVAPGGSCTITVNFQPKVAGALNSSLIVLTNVNGPGNPLTVALLGSGTADVSADVPMPGWATVLLGLGLAGITLSRRPEFSAVGRRRG